VDDLRAAYSEDVGLIVRAISFQDFQHMCMVMIHQRHRRTDGRTDGQMADGQTTCSASRGKKEFEHYGSH